MAPKYKEATDETEQLIMDNFVYILIFVPCIKDNKGILQSYTKPVLRNIITVKASNLLGVMNEKPITNQLLYQE